MAVKLKDIARETGVSISTVSRILNNDTSRKANDKTAARVLETAHRLGYFEGRLVPPHYLEYVSPKQAFSIGCILTSEHETYASPFFSSLLTGIQNEIVRQSSAFPNNLYVVYIKDPGFGQFLNKSKLDCAIMLGRTSLENISRLKKAIPNLVYAGVNQIGNGIDEVICDAQGAIEHAVEYLISLGHREIGFIGPTQHKHHVFNEHRYQGYLDGLQRENIAVNPRYVVDTILTAADGYESMNTLIEAKKLPTALICGNDTVAMGAMKALDEHGIMIPRDISIVGFDNIETVAYVKPSLTTIDIPKKELGRLAVKVLLDKLETKRPYHLKVSIPFQLVIRDSCRDIHNG